MLRRPFLLRLLVVKHNVMAALGALGFVVIARQVGKLLGKQAIADSGE
jgi:hypothetical protein